MRENCFRQNLNIPMILNTGRELESKLSHLTAMLDGDGRQLLEDVLSLRMSMDGWTNVDMFEAGFRIGVNTILEVLTD